MRRVGAVTVARSDFSILLPVLRRVQADPELTLDLVVAGMHLAPEFGRTVREVEAAGFDIVERVEMLMASDSPEGTATSMGLGLMGFGHLFTRWRPDILLIMGDRFEMFAAAAAALPFGIPIGHIHGGETSEGAIDEAFRHAITKMAHLHFTSTEAYRRRVVQLGEQPERVVTCGAPALDNLPELAALGAGELAEKFDITLDPSPLVVTFHPATLLERTAADTDALLDALKAVDLPIIFTAPNADPAGRQIRSAIDAFVADHPNAWLIESFGVEGYYSLLGHAAAMVGNSSSGIIEAASFELPVVNIGDRQKGRIAGDNVIHVSAKKQSIVNGIKRALDPAFRTSLRGLENPYGDGQASARIVDTIKRADLSPAARQKSFYDLPAAI